MTIGQNRLIQTRNEDREEPELKDEGEYRAVLRDWFGIVLAESQKSRYSTQ